MLGREASGDRAVQRRAQVWEDKWPSGLRVRYAGWQRGWDRSFAGLRCNHTYTHTGLAQCGVRA